MTDRTCAIVGCKKPYRSRGYCGSHYNQILIPDRHKTTRRCNACDAEYTTTRTDGMYCSLLCRDYTLWGPRSCPLPTARATKPKPAPFREERECAWCGDGFTATQRRHTMCSKRCKTKAGKTRRRALEANASGTYTWSEVTKVYLSLGRRCSYCHEQVNTFEPDHVIPLSKGGSNSITNIVPSCSLCNSDKRDLSLSEWDADRARRGLVMRSLDPRIKHLTYALLVA